MTFRVGGVRVKVSFWFFCGAMLLLGQASGVWGLFLGATAIHEGGHLAYMGWKKLPLGEVSLTPGGLVMGLKNGVGLPLSQELGLNLAGCGANFLAAALLYGLWWNHPQAVRLSAVNMALGLFNLLPVAGLDGADILKDSLILRLGWEKGIKLSRQIMKGISGIGMLLAGISLVHHGITIPGVLFFGIFTVGFCQRSVE